MMFASKKHTIKVIPGCLFNQQNDQIIVFLPITTTPQHRFLKNEKN